MTVYRLADRAEIYDSFDVPHRIYDPAVVAERDGVIVCYIAAIYTDDLLTLMGDTKLEGAASARVWLKLCALWERCARHLGYGGYILYVAEELPHWNSLVARVPVFTIIEVKDGVTWYKRLFSEAANGRKQESTSTTNEQRGEGTSS